MPRTFRYLPLILLLLASAASLTPEHAPAAAHRPNIVMVMTDDQSMNLVRYMPEVQQMQRGGVTFSNYFVTDSLCCPSRASMLTGQFPHDTHVHNNTPPAGGFYSFVAHGNPLRTYATALQAVGYRTSYMGKFMNGYLPRSHGPQPGWNNWIVPGSAYKEFDYTLNVNGRIWPRGHGRDDYLTDVLARQGSAFIDRAAQAHDPFLLTVAPFAPPPALRARPAGPPPSSQPPCPPLRGLRRLGHPPAPVARAPRAPDR